MQSQFGERIRDLRKARRMTQEDLADKCGLFRTYLSRLENGNANPTLTMIHALAVSLGVGIVDLFDPTSLVPEPAAKKSPPPSRGRVSR